MNNVVYTTEMDRYALFEKKSPSKFTRICIDGHITGSNKCAGYCQYEEHPGFLTTELMKQHNCIKKGCYHFIAKSKKPHEIEAKNDINSVILSHAQNLLSHNEGIRIMNVKNTEFKEYTISFITITNDYSFDDYIQIARELFGVEIVFNKLNYDLDRCIALLCAN